MTWRAKIEAALRKFTGKTEERDAGSDKSSDGKPELAAKRPPQVSFFRLFRFASRKDKLYMAIAAFSAAVHGSILPIFTIAFGGVINEFEGDAIDTEAIISVSKWFGILGLISFVLSHFQVFFSLRSAQSQCTRIRRLYFRALMSQEFDWYDRTDTGELTARVAADVDLIQAGVGDKVGSFLQFFLQFVVGFIVSFIYGWKMTLVILSVVPVLVLAGYLFGKVSAESTEEGQSAYGEAGAVANEVLSSIRTVIAYSGQEEESKRYDEKLDVAYRAGVKKAHMAGFSMGLTMFVMVCVYALGFWYGSTLVRRGEMNAGDVVTVFFAVIIAAMSIGQAAPNVSSFSVARGAAPRIFDVIDRKSAINPFSTEGETLDQVKGLIVFQDVSFTYESRPDQRTLDGMKFEVRPGSTLALVGPSGCGKSTTVKLIERFYDVLQGQILLDGVNIKSLNLQWLRSQIGYVSQMPTLFGVSIRENIALGAGLEQYKDPLTGKISLRRKEVSDDDIVAAAKLANAHDFIMKLPEDYSTVLGSGVSQLSGGQKQRVAIARALVRNPKILLLDEATSALDASSERIVQEALERAQMGRTTIVIAHRLSTVKSADVIAVVDQGRIAESGTHAELIDKPGGAYRKLVELQNVKAEKEVEGVPDETEDVQDDDSILHVPSARRTTDPRISSQTVSKSLTRMLDLESEAKGEIGRAVDKGIFRRTLRNNLREIPFMLLGVLGSAGAGSIFPVSALIFADVTDELLRDNRESRVTFLALMFVVLAVAAWISNYLYMSMNGISGERLTRKMRSLAFQALLRQEVAYFDLKENEIGNLTTRLATEATTVKGLTGDTFGAIAQAISTTVLGMVIAFVACWRVALAALAFFPGIVLGGYYEMRMMTGFDADAKKKYADSGVTAVEAVSNIDTVTSLGIQDHFCKIYNEKVEVPLKGGLKGAHVTGIAFGFSELCEYLIFLVSFWTGAKFIEDGFCDFESVLKALSGLLFAGFSLGNVSIFMPNLASSRVAATALYRLFDRISAIDPSSGEGEPFVTSGGEVDFREVKFEYPRRPDVPVLRGLNLSVSPKKSLALVGESGCGKSTIVSLIERYYDPRKGQVRFDGKDIRKLEVQSARSHLSIVSQEPDLFNRSVRENIAYGFAKTGVTVVTEDQVVEAAKAANAHDFIMDLPQGYDTLCGERGGQLSGGQRQRIAIARSLVRQPHILLLDEATSALDARSERVVQDALDKAQEGRTTIVVAHRLSTVYNADEICVLAKGKITERGTHEQLMARNGAYAKLVRNQMVVEAEAEFEEGKGK